MGLARSWFPWRFIIGRLARAHGFLDPLTLYARLQRFAKPAEVAEPVELLRAGAVFHARGLINSRAIQHNLDWVWPYWVTRQFDPADVSFLPRAFSLTHVNLTHRNWTAVGLPGRDALPIVDPRGLVTPFWDGWSIDVWLVDDDGNELLPSRASAARQRQRHERTDIVVETVTEDQIAGLALLTEAQMVATDTVDVCRMLATGTSTRPGWLVFALRPANPEGVSFIDHVSLDENRLGWLVNEHDRVRFGEPVERHHASRYHDADVHLRLGSQIEDTNCRCQVGLVTAAAMFRLAAGESRQVHVDVPISSKPSMSSRPRAGYQPRVRNVARDWPTALAGAATLRVPDEHAMHLFEAAKRTLILCTPDDIWAGPYTYKRFWYRDAVFIGHALLLAGLVDRVDAMLERFPEQQSHSGYFHSQEGEWDANGEVLWLAERVSRFTQRAPDPALWPSLQAGADWIVTKRLPDHGGQAHQGLLPAGFSAEHLGPNDHYYWDNAWSMAGLDAAARLADAHAEPAMGVRWRKESKAYRVAVEASLERRITHGANIAIPAAPARRLDSGAIGSVAFSYPLGLLVPGDARISGTLDYLLDHCFHDGGFFQDMIHSGVNAYLTLHVAQALLRAGDARYAALVRRVAKLASPTGHWPEAVHPNTGGGCMGDGHHAWAAAEWVAMMRNGFVREEGEALHLVSGLLPEWLQNVQGEALSFGPTPTPFGSLTVEIEPLDERGTRCRTSWNGDWHGPAPALVVAPCGHVPVQVEPASVGREGHVETREGSVSSFR